MLGLFAGLPSTASSVDRTIGGVSLLPASSAFLTAFNRAFSAFCTALAANLSFLSDPSMAGFLVLVFSWLPLAKLACFLILFAALLSSLEMPLLGLSPLILVPSVVRSRLRFISFLTLPAPLESSVIVSSVPLWSVKTNFEVRDLIFYVGLGIFAGSTGRRLFRIFPSPSYTVLTLHRYLFTGLAHAEFLYLDRVAEYLPKWCAHVC